MAGIDSFTILMLQLNNNVTDTETQGIPKIVTNNGVTFQNAQYPYSAQIFTGVFNGSSAYLQTPTSSDFELFADTTTDYTVDLFVYPTSNINGGAFYFVGQQDNDNHFWELRTNTGNILFNDQNLANQCASINVAATFTTSAWTHLAVVKSSGVITVYLGGTSVGNATMNGLYVESKNANLTIGRRASNADMFYPGYIAGLRMSKGIARWTANFTPPTSPYSLDSTAAYKTLMGIGV